MVDVEQLYKSFGVLADAKDKACEHLDSFQVILDGVKGNTAAKRLSAQFISRFFKHFPEEANRAIEALFDLCEDEDINIRKAAVKELPNLCKDDKQYVLRLTHVLVQILSSEDTSELSVVNNSLHTMFNLDAKATLDAVLNQILSGEDAIREKAIAYLSKKLKSAGDKLSKELEVHVMEECKKVLESVNGIEFATLIQGLSALQHIQTINGRQQLIDMISEQMDLSSDFSFDEDFNRVNQCLDTALGLCSKNVHGSKFVNYICQKVLPTIIAEVVVEASTDDEAAQETSSDAPSKGSQELELLKKLAEFTNFCGTGAAVEDCVELLFKKLKEYMPLPPAVDENEEMPTENPKLNFSNVECLMYTFHQLAKNKGDFLTAEDQTEELKDFKLRLQYFARGTKVYIGECTSSLAGKTATELEKETDNQLKMVALKTCNNINTLIKDLFRNPPSYKSVINLSWKKFVKPAATITTKTKKRLSDQGGAGGAPAAKKKDERSLYRAPSGKYSNSISYSGGRGGRGGRGGNRNGGGGGGRGGRRNSNDNNRYHY